MKSSKHLNYLALASSRYRKKGFKYIETPYIVSRESIEYTLPKGCHPFEVVCNGKNMGCLVGSAEQGFLEIYDKLKSNKMYFSYSPCFREEPVLNDKNQQYFSKIELFCKEPENPLSTLYNFMGVASTIMDSLCHNTFKTNVKTVQSFKSYDLHINGTEVGSYSIYSKKGRNWVCGTGLALPRFLYAQSL